jgi:glyoxylase-like metal-dependent hydrolase (beta-lactamase superfamily II)
VCEALGVSFWLIAILVLSQAPCEAQTFPRVREVGQGIYAIIGDLGPQRFDNDGLNANLEFVVGADAVLVINSGPSRRTGAAVLEEVRRITSKPIRWVVNLNSQNHYWWGNSALLDAKPTFIAHPEAVRLMKEQQDDQRALLLKLLRERFQGSEPWLPNRLVADRLTLDLGQRRIEILHLGAAHTPGDLAVWIPGARVLFSGDIIYTQRLPAVLQISRTKNWLEAFARIESLQPKIIVPGHGAPTTLAQAHRHTRDYLAHLRAEAKRLFESGGGPTDAADRIDQSRWQQLANFAELHRRNAAIVFLEMERELF